MNIHYGLVKLLSVGLSRRRRFTDKLNTRPKCGIQLLTLPMILESGSVIWFTLCVGDMARVGLISGQLELK